MLRTKQDGERTRSRSRCYAAAIAAMIAILGVPAAGLSQVTINFEITDDVDVNSLQFSVDYSGAPAGDLANCTGPGIGFLDFSVDSGSTATRHSTRLGTSPRANGQPTAPSSPCLSGRTLP